MLRFQPQILVFRLQVLGSQPQIRVPRSGFHISGSNIGVQEDDVRVPALGLGRRRPGSLPRLQGRLAWREGVGCRMRVGGGQAAPGAGVGRGLSANRRTDRDTRGEGTAAQAGTQGGGAALRDPSPARAGVGVGGRRLGGGRAGGSGPGAPAASSPGT